MQAPQGLGKPPRIVIIGGGSYTWSYLILRDFLASPRLEGSQIILHDINPTALQDVLDASRTLEARASVRLDIRGELDLDRALDGADFVIITIQVGGLQQYLHELNIPAKYGTFHSVSLTTGPGMVPRTLVNAPVFLDIAQRMERLCPQAWVLNYTNPITTLTRVITKHTRIRAIGLCLGIYGCLGLVGKLLGIEDRNRIELHYGGVNHGSFALKVFDRGQDRTAELWQKARQELATLGTEQEVDALGHGSGNVVRLEVLDKLGHVLGNTDRHSSEFWPYFHRDGGRRYRVNPTLVERRMAGLPLGIRQLHDIRTGKMDLPIAMGDEHDMAPPIIEVMTMGGEFVFPINMPNEGQIPNLTRGAIVECPAVVSPQGIRPVFVGDMPAPLWGMTATQIAIHELCVEAAMEGDVDKALQAIAIDPLLRDYRSARPMLLENIRAARELLPKFAHVSVPRPSDAWRAQPAAAARDAEFEDLLTLVDRCLLDLRPELLAVVEAGRAWVNAGITSAERRERGRKKLAALTGRHPLVAALGPTVEALEGADHVVWGLHTVREIDGGLELVFAGWPDENEKGRTTPFDNIYHRPALSVRLAAEEASFRWGCCYLRCAAFAAGTAPADVTDGSLASQFQMPEPVAMAGHKAIRLFDTLTWRPQRWRQRLDALALPETFAAQLLRAVTLAQTDMQLTEALLWASTTIGEERARLELERLAGAVLFEDLDPMMAAPAQPESAVAASA